ncbi:MAG: hypothetical protein ACYYKD_02480 [Rhodospirillales bacterium]
MKIHNLPPANMIEISLRAMTQMGHEYSSEWTNKYYEPWYAPEKVYVVAIGQALKTAAPGWVYLEYNINKIKKEARDRYRAKNPSLKRADILVTDCSLNGWDNPIFCTEVKKTYKYEDVAKDVERCREIVTKKGTVKNAAVLFLIHGQESAENHISAFENVQAEYGADFMVLGKSKVFARSAEDVNWQRYEYEYEKGYRPRKWAAAAVHIKA